MTSGNSSDRMPYVLRKKFGASPVFSSFLLRSEYPAVYVSHSTLFHGEFPTSYNGKVGRLSGQNLENYENVVTGIPIRYVSTVLDPVGSDRESVLTQCIISLYTK